VVAWHGNYAPYKYDLTRFCPVNAVSFGERRAGCAGQAEQPCLARALRSGCCFWPGVADHLPIVGAKPSAYSRAFYVMPR
jgi:hypothetical protein